MESRPVLASVLFAILGSAFLGAAPPAVTKIQGALPAAERLVYSRTIGDRRDRLETSVRLVEERGASWYEVSSTAEDQDSLLRLDAASLSASYIEVTSRGKDGTLKRVTTVVERKGQGEGDEILLLGAEALPYTLRAFPWGARQKARIAFMGSGTGGNFRFELTVGGKETLQAAGRSIECWKAQFALGGIFGPFVGKTTLWYTTAWPHYLVKSEGASGPPGSPQSLILLESYSGSGASE
jgi:hypothetical protein